MDLLAETSDYGQARQKSRSYRRALGHQGQRSVPPSRNMQNGWVDTPPAGRRRKRNEKSGGSVFRT